MLQPNENETEIRHPSERELLQFQHGELLPENWLEIQAHLAGCERCQMRLENLMPQEMAEDEALASLAQAFAKEGVAFSVPRVAPLTEPYPDFETIAAYLDGTLSPAGAKRFEALMIRLPGLNQEVESLRELKGQIRSDIEISTIAAPLADGIVSSQPSVSTPPMIVQGAEVPQAPWKVWWMRWLWPVQTIGTTAVTAGLLLIFGISPLNQQIIHERMQKEQRISELQGENSQYKIEKQKLELQSTQQNKSLKEKERKLEAAQNRLLTSREELNKQNKEITKRNREIERLKDALRAGKPAPPSPTQIPTPVSEEPFIRDGSHRIYKRGEQYVEEKSLTSEEVAAIRDGKLPIAPELNKLRSVATGTKGAAEFGVLSPVLTKVRELCPVLRWESVPGADGYEVTVRDVTEGNFRFELESSITSSWTVPEDLVPGHIYDWKVTAFSDRKFLGQAPQKRAQAARFEVMTEDETREVEKQLREAGDSLLKRSLVLARAGLRAEAQNQLDRLRKSVPDKR